MSYSDKLPPVAMAYLLLDALLVLFDSTLETYYYTPVFITAFLINRVTRGVSPTNRVNDQMSIDTKVSDASWTVYDRFFKRFRSLVHVIINIGHIELIT